MLISVVTPAYNAERYIGETIESLIIQGMPVEHIIVDDGSTDYTGASVFETIKQYPAVHWYDLKYFRQENSGEQKAVNTGLKFVTGDYFMILNADDLLIPNALKALVYCLERNPEALGVYPDWTVIDEDSRIIRPIKAPEYDFKYMLRSHRCIPSVGCMYRSKVIDIIGERDRSFIWIGDFDWWYRLGLSGDMVHLPLHLAQWRRHNGQMTSVNNPVRSEHRKLLIDKFYSLPGSEKYSDITQMAYAWSYIVSAVQTKSFTGKIKLLWKAFLSCPALLLYKTFWIDIFRYADYYIKTRF